MAQGWATAMAEQGYASVHNPDAATLIRDAGFIGWGENVGRTTQLSSQQMLSAWMNSAAHRNNILRSSYTHIGVGVDFGSNRHYTWVLNFGHN